MNIIKYPAKSEWNAITQRPQRKKDDLNAIVNEVIDNVKKDGDEAVRLYELKFDKVSLHDFRVSQQEFDDAESMISDELKEAIVMAHQNIAKFHQSQIFHGEKIETAPGVVCWQKAVPLQKVGLYVPGGTAPLFSTVLMLATPAKIAGCQQIVLCTPPASDGTVNPAILFAAKLAGVNAVFKIGGVQAIAAMAYGTQTVPNVFKIFGPGNQFVTAAKQIVSLYDVAIDMPAGPSEVAVVADATSNPVFVAADLLSQAEHGFDSQVLLVADNIDIMQRIIEETNKQLEVLPRKQMAEASLANSKFVLVHDMDEAMDIINEYAPEHLILAVEDYLSLQLKVVNAGSVFLGKYSCESAGDYASGTNHTLPTNGYAKAYSGVSLDSFCRKITFQELSSQGIKSIGKAVQVMAHNEMLNAHENAMTVRLNEVNR
jgi:histidinol dehydrogenase